MTLSDELPVDEILRRFDVAVARLFRDDQYLLIHDVSERAVTHKLGEYLQRLFPHWHVDCEYNRNRHEPKRVHLPDPGDQEAERYVSIYPDIIVHQRGANDRNLLIVEAKKARDGRGDGEARDRTKLVAYARELDYTVGVFIVFPTGEGCDAPCQRSYYHNGQWSG
jgi:hypothetical protein